MTTPSLPPSKGLVPHHLAIKTACVDRLATFYATVLGLPRRDAAMDPNRSRESVWFQVGTLILMIEKSETAPAPSVSHGLHLFALDIPVSTRPEWQQHLENHGVTITGESQYSLYFEDPDGNRLALSHYPVTS